MANPDHVVLCMDHQNIKTQPLEVESQPKNSTFGESKTSAHHAPARTITLLRPLSFSKPKSRNVEFNHPPPTRKPIFESEELEPLNPIYSTSDDEYDDEGNDEEEEEDFEKGYGGGGGTGQQEEFGKRKRWRRRKISCSWRTMAEWIIFMVLLMCLVCSLAISSLNKGQTWGLKIWKWFLVVMVLLSGHLVAGWVVDFLVFLVERNFMLRERVLYFVYGLRKSFQKCIWLGLVLLTWTFVFNAKIHKNNKKFDKVFQALVAVLVGATIWLMKIVLVKVLASSFHVSTYFDRMKESVFHHYVLDTLSRAPMEKEVAYVAAHRRNVIDSESLPARLRRGKSLEKTNKFLSRSVDMEKLRKLSLHSRKSAWNVKRLVSYVRSSGLTTVSNPVDEFGNTESEITSEWEAKNAAKRTFKNVAKPDAKHIEEEDLMRFLSRVEIHTIFPLFEGALETGRITKSAFRNWVVRAYFERKALAHSLNDTKMAVHQMHKLASAVVSVIIIVVGLLVIGLATTKIVFFVTTQMVLVGVMFHNSCKTVFESIIFVFVMHPFDIGDRCVIDGVQLVVEEMNILTTVFLRHDMEKIYYPNSVLITKPISNFYRSPEMCDTIDFTVDISTSIESINALKKSIQIYVESKPKHWNPKHTLRVNSIENMNKMKMSLVVQHTINHQNFGERNNRITDLILELKKIFENLHIKYNLLPQEIHLTQVNNVATWRLPQH